MIRMLAQLLFLTTISSIFIACETDESDLIFQAETCINEKSGTGSISQCQQYLSSLSSPRANTLKCKIKLEMSGLTNSRIIEAIDLIEDSSNTNEVEFMGLISLNSTSEADESAAICSNTESPGLEFIADSAMMGTYFVDALPGLNPGEVTPDTNFSSTDVNDMVDNCVGDTSCETAIGTAAESMYGIYCNDENITDVEVCTDVNAAIENGGTPASIGIYLLGLLDPTP